jgi:hypothetical protein
MVGSLLAPLGELLQQAIDAVVNWVKEKFQQVKKVCRMVVQWVNKTLNELLSSVTNVVCRGRCWANAQVQLYCTQTEFLTKLLEGAAKVACEVKCRALNPAFWVNNDAGFKSCVERDCKITETRQIRIPCGFSQDDGKFRSCVERDCQEKRPVQIQVCE